MAKQEYLDFNFRADTHKLINIINGVINEYLADGLVLTVRQLYYQLVARDHIPNTEKSYKRITGVVNDGRLSGLIDWDAIEDRTRAFIRRGRWTSARSILESAAHSFHMDMWEMQENRVFCIVEKEALAGVLERVCNKYDVPLLAARGYPSVTVLREFARDDIMRFAEDQDVTILHLGDHDPSGLDMTRDLESRIELFSENVAHKVNLVRIALNMDQIRAQKPPPNPAKTTDSRFKDYRKQFGDSSWELDALNPRYLANLVESHITPLIEMDLWEERQKEIQVVKNRIEKFAEEFA